MNLFSTSSLILSLSSIFFSFIVYRTDKGNAVGRAWLYSSLAFSLWALGLYGVTSTHSATTALMWQYLLDVSAIVLPALYFNFISELFKFKNSIWRLAFLVASVLLAIFSFSELFKYGVIQKYDFFWVSPGPLYMVFPIYFGVHALIAIGILVYQYFKQKDPIIHAQIRNTMIAGLMGYIGGSSNFFPQFFNVYPYGNYLVILFIVFMVYGVLRYKLLSAKVISAQIFSTALILVFLFNILRSDETTQWLINFVMFLFVCFFSVLLIRSVGEEVKARQQIENLAKDLSTANDRLRELDQQKSEFVSLASHQLRGPLTAVKGYASMLVDGDFGVINAEAKDALDKIFESVQGLIVVVGDYLDVSRIEQGRMQYDFTNFNLRDLVATVVTELKPNLARAKLSIEFNYDSNGTYQINADQGKIKQVIGNLIDNAIKYTPQGGLHVWLSHPEAISDGKSASSGQNNSNTTSVSVSNKVLLSISDTGVGIHPDVLPRLFEKFTRAPDASKTNIMGTGLGLYVAKKIMEAHHARIWAESPGPGKGSTFFIEFDELNAVNPTSTSTSGVN